MSHVATDTNWAVSEFADAALGDERRTKRLVELAHVLGQHPTAALPEACGDGGMLKAAYRFFDHDAIDAQDLLQSPVESTSRRLDHASVVLAGQETTDVNWPRHPSPQGLVPLGHGRSATGGRTSPLASAASSSTGHPGHHVGAAVLPCDAVSTPTSSA